MVELLRTYNQINHVTRGQTYQNNWEPLMYDDMIFHYIQYMFMETSRASLSLPTLFRVLKILSDLLQ